MRSARSQAWPSVAARIAAGTPAGERRDAGARPADAAGELGDHLFGGLGLPHLPGHRSAVRLEPDRAAGRDGDRHGPGIGDEIDRYDPEEAAAFVKAGTGAKIVRTGTPWFAKYGLTLDAVVALEALGQQRVLHAHAAAAAGEHLVAGGLGRAVFIAGPDISGFAHKSPAPFTLEAFNLTRKAA